MRAGLATAPISVEDLEGFVKPVYKKNDASEQAIRDVLLTSSTMQVLVGHLNAESLTDVVNAFEEVVMREGDVIMQQGEEGDNLYIIGQGLVNIFVRRQDDTGRGGGTSPGAAGEQVATFGAGQVVGELALMYMAPRAATVVVSSPACTLWRLHRSAFRMLVAKDAQKTYKQYEGWLSDV